MSAATDPMLLPPEAPTISDFQRAKVLRAEAELSSSEPAAARDAVEEAAAEATELGGGSVTVEWGEAGRGSTYRKLSESQGLIIVEEGASMHSVLRSTSHHLVHPVFPPHGVEWVRAFLASLERHLGPEVRRAYERAYEDLEVHSDPSVRIKRVRKSALGAVNKERGVLARVVADDGPESVICQLLELLDDALLITNHRGERRLDLSRLRYLSYKLTEG